MLKVSLPILVILATTLGAVGQESSRAELFGGYSVGRIDIATNFPQTQPQHATVNGLTAAFTWYFNRWFGAQFDFSGNFASPQASFIHPTLGTPVSDEIENRLFTLFAGPVLRYPTERVTLSFRPRLGQFRLRQEAATAGLEAVDNDFAFALGGALDVNVHPRIALRVAPDYIRSYLTPDAGQNNWRLSTGVVISVGRD